jgi:hypothetical protein
VQEEDTQGPEAAESSNTSLVLEIQKTAFLEAASRQAGAEHGRKSRKQLFRRRASRQDLEAPTLEGPKVEDLEAPTLREPKVEDLEAPTLRGPKVEDLEAPTLREPKVEDLEAPTLRGSKVEDLEAPTLRGPKVEDLEGLDSVTLCMM